MPSSVRRIVAEKVGLGQGARGARTPAGERSTPGALPADERAKPASATAVAPASRTTAINRPCRRPRPIAGPPALIACSSLTHLSGAQRRHDIARARPVDVRLPLQEQNQPVFWHWTGGRAVAGALTVREWHP